MTTPPEDTPQDHLDPVREILSAPEDISPGDLPPRDEGTPPPHGPDPGPQEDEPPEAAAARCPLNDIGNGARFAIYHGDQVLWVPRVGWHVWDGTRWAKDPDMIAVRKLGQGISARMEEEIAHIALEPWQRRALDDLPAAREVLKAADAITEPTEEQRTARAEAQDRVLRGERVKAWLAKQKAAYRTFAKTTGNSDRITKMLAEAGVNLSAPHDALDPEPLAVNTPQGTLRFSVTPGGDGASPVAELRLDPHAQEDRITKRLRAAYDPEATCPGFEAFLARIMPDIENRRFLARTFGLALTETAIQRVWFFYGSGANGKSVLVDLMARLMGDYAATAKIESLTGQTKRGGDSATPDLIPLMRARMVRASEPDQGERLKEGMIKEMTGGEPILVRALHQDFIEIHPRFKLILSGNHKPEIRGTDDGIWRRVILVPFDVQIPEAERDPDLGEKLLAEGPGILNWLISGLMDYLEGGLRVPQAIQDATAAYREDSDPIGAFLAEATRVTGDPADIVPSKELVDAFNWWLQADGQTPWSGRQVALRLKDHAERWRDPTTGRSFSYTKKPARGYRGLQITPDFASRMADGPASSASPDPDYDL